MRKEQVLIPTLPSCVLIPAFLLCKDPSAGQKITSNGVPVPVKKKKHRKQQEAVGANGKAAVNGLGKEDEEKSQVICRFHL
jgi:hypothetical protein